MGRAQVFVFIWWAQWPNGICSDVVLLRQLPKLRHTRASTVLKLMGFLRCVVLFVFIWWAQRPNLICSGVVLLWQLPKLGHTRKQYQKQNQIQKQYQRYGGFAYQNNVQYVSLSTNIWQQNLYPEMQVSCILIYTTYLPKIFFTDRFGTAR